jgi:hypothetical protein
LKYARVLIKSKGLVIVQATMLAMSDEKEAMNKMAFNL